MNRKIKTIVISLMLAAILSVPSLAAVRTGAGVLRPVSVSAGTESRKFGKVPSSARVLITVESNGEEKNATGSLTVYKRGSSEEPWKAVITDAAAFMGRGGMGKNAEGDQKTPCGMFTMNTPFGRKDKEYGFPDNYLKLDGNYYWGEIPEGTHTTGFLIREMPLRKTLSLRNILLRQIPNMITRSTQDIILTVFRERVRQFFFTAKARR